MQHRISCGALVMRDERILLVRHYRPGRHDFWVAPGGGVEGSEELARAAERETFEEAGIHVVATRLAYIDEGWSAEQRILKFWFLADYVSGELDVAGNPAAGEHIVEAGWFPLQALPEGHVFQNRYAAASPAISPPAFRARSSCRCANCCSSR